MKFQKLLGTAGMAASLPVLAMLACMQPAAAQNQSAAVQEQTEDVAPPPLSESELDILVARIALYPDELVAVITASSLYPLQVVQAARFLERVKNDASLKPSEDWDGSVISLLNYPDIVMMMNDDLEWTEKLGNAVTYQEADLLSAVQRLRQQAVDNGVLKSDDRMKIVREDNNIAIEPASQELIYVPRYEPEMLYEPNYVQAPIVYYPEPYPSYYYPTAPYFAGFVTGVVWGAVIDWDRRGVWGGRWGHDSDVYITCNHCYRGRNVNGRVKWNDVDWRHVDRSKIKFDKSQMDKVDRKKFKKSLEADDGNNLKKKAREAKRAEKSGRSKEGLKSGDGVKAKDGLKPKDGLQSDTTKQDATRTGKQKKDQQSGPDNQAKKTKKANKKQDDKASNKKKQDTGLSKPDQKATKKQNNNKQNDKVIKKQKNNQQNDKPIKKKNQGTQKQKPKASSKKDRAAVGQTAIQKTDNKVRKINKTEGRTEKTLRRSEKNDSGKKRDKKKN